MYYSLLDSLKEFERISMKAGDIRTKKIILTKAHDLKLMNVGTVPWEKTGYEQVAINYNSDTIFYLGNLSFNIAPEEVENISKRDTNKFSNSKTESFSLGLCILEMATLLSS